MNAADRQHLRDEISARVIERESTRRAIACDWCGGEINHDSPGNGKPKRFCSMKCNRAWNGRYCKPQPDYLKSEQ